MRPRLTSCRRLRLLRRELADLRRFRNMAPAERQVVFYAAQAQYHAYFAGMLAALVAAGVTLTYITSDAADPLLNRRSPGINAVYLNRLFPFAAPFINARVAVLTMPYLHRLHIRRSIYDVHYIFVFHSMCSAHMGLHGEALAHFDAVFCNGPYHVAEIRALEEMYGLQPKELVKTGYYRLENLYREHQEQDAARPRGERPLVVIAPSWQRDNILEACGLQLVESLLAAGNDVVFRPHPMITYRRPQQLAALREAIGARERFRIDTSTESNHYLHLADLLVCDWSGVAMEYALGTERPVLFIDLPPKVHNPEYAAIGLPPLEMAIRAQIGRIIPPQEVGAAAAHVAALLAQKEAYRAQIVAAREEHLYHFGRSAEISAAYILDQL